MCLFYRQWQVIFKLCLKKPWVLNITLNTICHPLKDLQWHSLDLEFTTEY